MSEDILWVKGNEVRLAYLLGIHVCFLVSFLYIHGSVHRDSITIRSNQMHQYVGNPSGGECIVPCGRADKHEEPNSGFWPILGSCLNKDDQYIVALGRSTTKPVT